MLKMHGRNSLRGQRATASERHVDAAVSRYRFALTADRVDSVDTDCIVAIVYENAELSPAAEELDALTGGMIRELYRRGTVSGLVGSVLFVPLADGAAAVKAMALVGAGGSGSVNAEQFRMMVSAAHRRLVETGVRNAVSYLAQVDVAGRNERWKVRQQVVVFEDEGYRFRTCLHPEFVDSLRNLTIASLDLDVSPLVEANAMATAIRTARLLGDMPPNICSPEFLGDFATRVAESQASMSVNVLDEQDMLRLGMGALLSVGNASDMESRLIVLTHHGADSSERPVVLIGKGVTFDTGGTALKTRSAMRLMKYDMCGAAVVMGVLRAVAMLDLPINVVGIAACAENMPGGKATRPGDTVTSMSGKTVEILNPDAEGRLLLCDALTYAERFDPESVVDVATLTGASLTALGRHFSAMLTEDDDLSAELIQAGDMVMDRCWRLPLSRADLEQLDTDFADIANMGDGTAGCVVAALFLSQFSQAFRWAHLDVSNTAKIHGDAVGATGRPAALLLQFLLNRVNKT